jgi:hypothetical protein
MRFIAITVMMMTMKTDVATATMVDIFTLNSTFAGDDDNLSVDRLNFIIYSQQE